jgi:diadenosine tetraphosphate (Ap4A) HIT family hydrolase
MLRISSNLKIFESSHCQVYLSPTPILSGHSILFPKQEVQSLSSLPPEASLDIFQSIQRLSEILKSYYNCSSFTIEFKDQVHPLLFFNLIPRKSNDLAKNDDLYIYLENFHSIEDNESLWSSAESLRCLL